ncbi:hypothetical protein HQ325_16825 [Rhodococcus sp. BP-349]|uniref:GDSL-type esterase/lipase family protein n=1 Tax=unclassified Rhodococcus (in: high G+C Gram-positive bacteria) TaxID=192944 RepID=UPI001C9B7D10|nr:MULTISPECIES: GDSL-type esterase/lipase family protein [unclassified Rhodococcus (in: high G+C Gram-positive bacteria)]MBY6540340.1 hypothetical protein [Rhodococcus sp. BP-363]MBY6545635.1 hypothetical protein [Rhodococcus sp. BP-369]MBY6564865.1 hypothetical protein [Rhodococcus sp. BP-370]MBY6578199.1 hypothetical protein [Rhodococcus sp. BP-364]MBY6587500.1 hypothetical protein [Rhodococcus sp. BP-358]
MTDSHADPSRAPHDSLPGEFSPGLLRRLIVEPLLTPVLTRFLGPGQVMRASQFEQFPAPEGHVVLLGDSITELGLWQEWFPGLPVSNRGIGGQVSIDLLHRLDTAIGRPAAVFLLIGTNDLTFGVPLHEIVRNVRALLSEIERRAPGTPVVVQSVMPRTRRYRDDLVLLNRAYRSVVEHSPDHVEYLDLWPALADESGDLRVEFTVDATHLTGAGYAAWMQLLRPRVERFITLSDRSTRISSPMSSDAEGHR